MLTPADAALYDQSINASHKAVFRVSVRNGQGDPLQEIDYLDGAVSVTLGSQVTRNAELLIDPALSPKTEFDLLFPNGNRLFIERGIDYGCGDPQFFPVFHGRIQSVFDIPDGPTRLRAIDLAGDIRDAGFTVPKNSIPTAAILAEFERLVKEALPSATFGVSDIFAVPVGVRAWDTDRAQALDDLATSVGAFWYTLSNGDFVMRRVPWTIPRIAEMSITDALAPGDCQSGEGSHDYTDSLAHLYATYSTRERSREQVANVITVAAELVNGQPPQVFTAADNDPTSVTYIGGNFGIKSRHVRTDVAQTAAQVKLIAETTLKRSKAILDNWSLQTIPDGRIELGDCITVACQKVTSTQVIAAFRIPLNTQGRMDIGTRALLAEVVVGQL